MNLPQLFKMVCTGMALTLACALPARSMAQTPRQISSETATGSDLQSTTIAQAPAQSHIQPVITLDPPTGSELQTHTMDSKGNLLPEAPANFRRLGEARVGEPADVHTLTLRFSQTARITGVSVTGDFKIEPGGSCFENSTYQKDSTCTLLVRFTPQGPGNRMGHVEVTNSLSATPDAFGLGGNGYSPVLSFIPSIITTVPGTYPLSKGLLSGAQNLTVDAGDTLWISDAGNGLVRNMDAGGTIKTLASGYTGASGIAVDSFGEAYFDVPSTGKMYEIYDYGPVVQSSGSGADSCPSSAPCTLSAEALGTPGEMSIDPYNHLFFVDSHSGAAFSTVQPTPANLIYLYDPFPYQQNPSAAMAVDAGDNLYSLWANGGVCEIVQHSLYNAENSNVSFVKVAGGHTCGFAGDGGLAGNAEIGNRIGQIAFDAAGNLYFSDSANQRVRRIDYVTGIIHTIAGNGTAGYTGDGSLATTAELSSPTGVGVDSQGQVYIISSATSGQVVRKIETVGEVYAGYQLRGTSGAPHMLTVSNTGNSAMTLTNTVITGADAADFKIDPNTTSCVLTAGSSLYAGATCQVGIIFTPAAGGDRIAQLVFLDNTATNSNTVILSGAGTLPAAAFAITSPTNGGSYSGSSPVTFSVTVKSSSGPAPTGTVTFKVDGTTKATVTIVSGAASTSVTGLATGPHTFSATYSGDSNYEPGGPITVSITGTTVIGTPMVSLMPAMNPDASCNSMSFEAVVTSNKGTPTGKVHLMDGSTELATGSLNNGRASLIPPAMAAGVHAFIAHYDGDANNQPAVSKTLNQTVSRPGPCGPPTAGALQRASLPVM